ncbi:hypothetical protein V6N12_016845 [Hibiscus sabdariffa]|uniref:Uncharacterized protein n=1 Tax=Hibiscus sabdariffa TaxID=183260 RepID=A0ABR2BPD2_9ROSI
MIKLKGKNIGVECSDWNMQLEINPNDGEDMVLEIDHTSGSHDRTQGVVAPIKCIDQSSTMSIDLIRGARSVESIMEDMTKAIVELIEDDDPYGFRLLLMAKVDQIIFECHKAGRSKDLKHVHCPGHFSSGHPLESELGNFVKNALDAYRFSRPHTVIVTTPGIISVSLLSSPFYIGASEAVIAALMMNIYTVGSWPLIWTLFISFVLGTAYSINSPLLRWKGFALDAA